MKEQILEISTGTLGIEKRVKAIQGDSDRVLKCILTDFTIPSTATARIYAAKPSGTKIYNNGTIDTDDNSVDITLTTQILAEIGDTNCQVEIYESSKYLTSFEFIIEVKRRLKDSSAIESTDEFTALEEALAEADKFEPENNARIDDDVVTTYTTYSSNKIEKEIKEKALIQIDDSLVSTESTYSSSKIESLNFEKAVLIGTGKTSYGGGVNLYAMGSLLIAQNIAGAVATGTSITNQLMTYDVTKYPKVASDTTIEASDNVSIKITTTGVVSAVTGTGSNMKLTEGTEIFVCDTAAQDTQIQTLITQLAALQANSYTKTEVDAKISSIPKFTVLVVNTLPTTGKENIIYLLKSSDSTCTGYVYQNNTWEKLPLSVDLGSFQKRLDDAIYKGSQNLLQPTLATTTVNGVTCTNNGDGTYTLNGTASDTTRFVLSATSSFLAGKYEVIGCPSGGSSSTYKLEIRSSEGKVYAGDTGNGANFTLTSTKELYYLLWIGSGVTLSSYTFKPMITTDTTATYDDFEPYYECDILDLNNNIDSLQNEGYNYPNINGVRNYTDKDGVYHKNLGVVDLGTFDWTYNSTNSQFYATFSTDGKNPESNNYVANAKCTKYTTVAYNLIADNSLAVTMSGSIVIKNSTYTDAATFKSAMSGVLLYYELATPQTWNDKAKIEDYLPLAGGTVTGNILSSGNKNLGSEAYNFGTVYSEYLDVGCDDGSASPSYAQIAAPKSAYLTFGKNWALKTCAWMNTSTLAPWTSGTLALGTSSLPWGQIYSTSTTISTSDRNEKNSIVDMSEDVSKFVMDLKPVTYKFNNGTSDRTHYGLIAQDVEDTMTNLGMDSKDFAGFIKFEKEDRDESGDLVKTGEYGYALRYEEFIAPLIKMVQMQENKISELESEIKTLKSSIQ